MNSIGVLTGKVGTGMCDPEKGIFGIPGLPMVPFFLFENQFKGQVFAKCLTFNNFPLDYL